MTYLLAFLVVTVTPSWSLAVPPALVHDAIRRVARSSDHDQVSTAFIRVMDYPYEAGIQGERQDEKYITLDVESTGEQLRMSLTRTKGVDTSGIRIFEHTEEGQRELNNLEIRDCFYDGPLVNQEGHVVMSLCEDQLLGSILTQDRLYNVLPLPRLEDRSDAGRRLVLLTWKDENAEAMSKFLRNDAIPIPEGQHRVLGKDETAASDTMTVEIGNYLDEFYIDDCKDKLSLSTNQQLTDLQLFKFTQAAKILNSGGLSYNVVLKVSQVHIMRTNPSWYQPNPQDKIGERLKAICQGTKSSATYDQVTLSTSRTSDSGTIGIAYVGGACKPDWRCSVSRAVNNNYWTELHELGHSLGLNHDEQMPDCKNDPGTTGFMSMHRDVFRACYKKTLEKTFADKSIYGCLRRVNTD